MATRSTLTRIGHALFTLGLSLALAVLFFHFVFQPFQVSGLSMSPTLKDQDYLLVDRLFMGTPHLRRGEIMVLQMPQGGPFIVKRLVGLPGDSVEIRDGVIRVNGKVFPPPPGGRVAAKDFGPFRVPQGHLFFLGDNGPVSLDSRQLGAIPLKDLYGRVVLRYLPLSRWGFIPKVPHESR